MDNRLLLTDIFLDQGFKKILELNKVEKKNQFETTNV
jgi:hypothetical protein